MAHFTVQGFKAIPAKCKEKSSVTRWLFIKQHSIRDKIPEKPADRTLFVINVPPFCDEHSLTQTFSICGDVDAVYCHSHANAFLPPQDESEFFSTVPRITGYKVAYVVFESTEGLLKALTLDVNSPLILCEKNSQSKTGMQKWCDEYNNKIINKFALQREIDLFMQNFDKEEQKKELAAKNATEADEGGWVTVTSKSRKRGIARTENARKKILEKEKKKRSKKELKNFYTFQIRESKMKHIETMRRKFEEDKKKINTFKQTRRFKPF